MVFSAPAGSPVLKKFIDLCVDRIKNNLNPVDIKNNEHFIHHITGPAVFTDGIKLYLEENNQPIEPQLVKYQDHQSKHIWIHDREVFHRSYVVHHFSGGWDNGWKKQRDIYWDKMRVEL